VNKKKLEASSYEVIIGGMRANQAILSTRFTNLSLMPSSMRA
jgi:hypothetical protein